MARLENLQYRESTFYAPDGQVGSVEVLRIYFRTHEDEHDQFDLPNGGWQLSNKALQFLAKWGYRPSDIGDHDSAMRDCHDDQVLIPIAPDGEEDGWGLAEEAMQGAQEALEDAEWFASDAGEESSESGSDAPGGGGSPDPGTGNRGAVDDASQGGVSAEMAGEDSDRGVNVHIS